MAWQCSIRPRAGNSQNGHEPSQTTGLIHFRGFFHVKQFLLCTSPEAVHEVLLDKPYDYTKPTRAAAFLSKILGDGLVILEGQEHKISRKIVAPAHKNLQRHSQVSSARRQSPESVAASWVSIVASRVTLDIIGIAGLGRDFRALQNSDDELAKNCHQITDPASVRIFIANMLFPPWLVRMVPWSEHKRFDELTSALRQTAYKLLNEKRESLTQSTTQRSDDILTVLLKSKTPLADNELIDQLLTFLAAGHETTSSALAWNMHLLAKHPEIQHQLRAEVLKTLEDSNSNNDHHENGNVRPLDALPLLSAICNESLRLYPTVPNTARRAVRPTSIMGYPIAPKTDVLLSPWMINRHRSLWGADDDTFRPSRWVEGPSANNGGASSSYAFLTFLHGPRSCIGQGFARTELKYLLAAVLRRFEWEMEDPEEVPVPAGAVTIKPKTGLRVRLTEL